MTIPMAIKRREPHLGPNPDWAKAFYADPPSHDFCVWLIIAELMRRYHGAPGPLKVRFGLYQNQLGILDFGPNGIRQAEGYECKLSRDYYETMLANVLRPAMDMIGAVEEPPMHAPFTLSELEDYCEYDYHGGHLIDAARQGHEIPKWQPPQWAHDEVEAYLAGVRPVIITLREAPAQPERNSQLDEWLKFAQSIKDEHPVLILRDTAKAHESLYPFWTWPRASENAYIRAALYQCALVNMLVGNGPIVWCVHSDAPYLIFKQLVPSLPDWEHGQPIGWKHQEHMDVGDQLPWALPQQQLTWLDDTYGNISLAFDFWRKGSNRWA